VGGAGGSHPPGAGEGGDGGGMPQLSSTESPLVGVLLVAVRAVLWPLHVGGGRAFNAEPYSVRTTWVLDPKSFNL